MLKACSLLITSLMLKLTATLNVKLNLTETALPKWYSGKKILSLRYGNLQVYLLQYGH